MPRPLIILFILGLLAGVVQETWKVVGPRKEPPFWKRWSAQIAEVAQSNSPAADPDVETDLITRLQEENRPVTSVPRTWVATDGRRIEAIATAADESSVQLRVLPAQTVFVVPLDRLSPEDREFVARWSASEANPSRPNVPPPSSWPVAFDGGARVAVTETAEDQGGFRWESPRYELRSPGRVDFDLISALASVCESIDAVCRRAPLPLLWGRQRDERRVIVIHPTVEGYLKAGLIPNSAGCFEIATGTVHVCQPYLIEDDLMGLVQGYTLEKRAKYSVLVHELIHQATPGLTLGGFPAWVPEGIAEYFAAVQHAPGRFRFQNSHVAVRDYAVSRLGADGVVDLRVYRLWHLEQILGRPLGEWNQFNVRGGRSGQGLIQYLEALLLVDYFCQGDSPQGRGFRAYLKAVLTGASTEEATRLHLLRGRSFADLERDVAAYWSQRGCSLAFEKSPKINLQDVRIGVGVQSRLSGPRRR